MSSSRLFHKEEVTGKTVIDSTGRVTGKVKDVLFSLGGGVILVVEKKDGAEVQLPLSMVLGVSEFVVTRGEASLGASPALEGERACKFCGHDMGSDPVYCPGCGKAQV